MYFLVREKRYKQFTFKCPWIGGVISCNSPAGCKLLKLFGLVFNFLASVSPFHSSRNFPSFFLSCFNNNEHNAHSVYDSGLSFMNFHWYTILSSSFMGFSFSVSVFC